MSTNPHTAHDSDTVDEIAEMAAQGAAAVVRPILAAARRGAGRVVADVPGYAEHQPVPDPINRVRYCAADERPWPCEVGQAYAAGLAGASAIRAQRDRLVEVIGRLHSLAAGAGRRGVPRRVQRSARYFTDRRPDTVTETTKTDAPALIFRSQSGRTEVARFPDGTLHVSVLTGSDSLDWPELERLVDTTRDAGRRQAADAIRTQMVAGAAIPPDLAGRGRPTTGAFAEWAARIAEGGEPRG